MNLNRLSERINLRAIMEFVIDGDYELDSAAEKPYRERFADAEKKTKDFCAHVFQDEEKRAEVLQYILQQIDIHESISFEMGLLIGVKIAMEAQRKLEEFKL